MGEIPGGLLRHQVDVEPYVGSGPYGDAYDKSRPVRCWRDDGRKLVRDGNGEQVVSTTTLLARLADAEALVPGSRVTVDGRTAYVISLARRDDAGMGAWQHAEATLT
jgi:hypothetical protein